MSDIPVPFYGEFEQRGGFLYPLLPNFDRRIVVAEADPVIVNPGDGQLLGGPFGKYNVNPVPVPLLGLNPYLMITSSDINRFENYETMKEEYKALRKDLGSPYKGSNRKGGFVMWKDSKIKHKVKDENTSPNILYTYVKLTDGVNPGVDNTNQFFDPVTKILKVRGKSLLDNYGTILGLIGQPVLGDKNTDRRKILENTV